MEQQTFFQTQIIARFLGCRIPVGREEIIDLAKIFLNESKRFEAFLVLLTLEHKDKEVIDMISDTLKFQREMLRKPIDNEKELVKKLFSEGEINNHKLCNRAIRAFIAMPFSGISLTYLLLAEITAPDKQVSLHMDILAIIKRLNEFIKEIGDYSANVLSVVTKFQMENSEGVSSSLLNSVLERLPKESTKDYFLSLWLYWSYLGIPSAAEPAKSLNGKDVNLSQEYLDFLRKPRWSWYLQETLENDYREILKACNDSQAGVLKNTLKKHPLTEIVPLILHAHCYGDVQIASVLLSHLYLTHSFPSMQLRISEINGGWGTPENFVALSPALREKWFTKKANLCINTAGRGSHKDFPESEILAFKEFYMIQPFDSELLKAMLKAAWKTRDPELQKMLGRSLHRITSTSLLEQILRQALVVGSIGAVKASTLQLLALDSPMSLLSTSEAALAMFTSPRTRNLINGVLDAYDVATAGIPKYQHTNFSLKASLIRNMVKGFDQNDFDFVEKNSNSILHEEMIIKEWENEGEWELIVQAVLYGKLLTVQAAEVAFQKILLNCSASQIVNVYQNLVRRDAMTASFYQVVVAPILTAHSISLETETAFS